MKPLVDFVVIGSMKAGTSTLYETLSENSYVNLTRRKEVNFFNDDITEDKLDCYRSEFDLREGIKGDISPNYSKRHEYAFTAQQIQQHASGAKIIYILRDPVNRIVSHIHHDMYRGRLNRNVSVAEALAGNSGYIQTSKYYWQLTPYLDHFPAEQLLLISFEHLLADPGVTLSKIYNFLEIGEYSNPIALSSRNLTSKKYMIPFHDAVRDMSPVSAMRKAYHSMWHLVNIKVNKPEIGKNEIDYISNELAFDIAEISKIDPSITSSWRTVNLA